MILSIQVCSFSFKIKEDNNDFDTIECNFFPSKDIKFFELKINWLENDSDFLEIINSNKNVGIKRLTIVEQPILIYI